MKAQIPRTMSYRIRNWQRLTMFSEPPSFSARVIAHADDIYHKAIQLLVSEAYWQITFGSDREVLNRMVRVNGQLFTIVV